MSDKDREEGEDGTGNVDALKAVSELNALPKDSQ
jgi:hypothetical protein